MPIGLKDPIPDDLDGLMERLNHEAKSLTNGDVSSPDNVHRRGTIDACIAKIQAVTTIDLVSATRSNGDATRVAVTATKRLAWATLLMAGATAVLAVVTIFSK